jgi:hypothetical protein
MPTTGAAPPTRTASVAPPVRAACKYAYRPTRLSAALLRTSARVPQPIIWHNDQRSASVAPGELITLTYMRNSRELVSRKQNKEEQIVRARFVLKTGEKANDFS